MRKFIGLLAFLVVVLAPNAIAAQTPILSAQLPVENLLLNPGFENGTYAWTVSGGATKTVNTTANLGQSGGHGFDWNSNGANQTLISSAVTIPDYLKGRNGYAYCSIKTVSGSPTHTLTVYDGSNDIVTAANIIVDTSKGVLTPVSFVFPTSGTIALKMKAIASDEPEIYIDQCFVGPNYTQMQVAQASMVGSAYINATANCTPTRTSATLGAFVDTDCPGASVETNPGPGTIQATDYDTVKFAVNSLPPGTYEVEMHASVYVSTSSQPCSFAINDGTSNSGNKAFNCVLNVDIPITVKGVFTYTTTANHTFELYGASAANALNVDITTATGGSTLAWFYIRRYPSANETAYRPELYNWRVDATIAGANPSLGTASVSSYTGIEDTGLTLTNNAGSGVITAQIPCHTTTAPTGTTCSGVAESVGVVFTLPTPQDVRACVSFTWDGKTSASTTSLLDAAFEIVETPTNAQTISQEGNTRFNHKLVTNTTIASENGVPTTLCGNFTFATAGQKALRLMYEQLVANTPTTSEIEGDQNSSVGQRDIHWEVWPISQAVPAPYITQGVVVRDNVAGSTTINTIVSKSANYTATSNDETIVFTADATLSLPAAATVQGKKYHVVSSGTGTDVTIDPNASETVCGQTTISVRGANDTAVIQSDGTNWVGLEGSCYRTIGFSGNSGATPPNAGYAPGDCVGASFANPATGRSTVAFDSGCFSAAPACTCTATEAGTAPDCSFSALPTTSTVEVRTRTTSTAALVATDWIVFCKGAR